MVRVATRLDQARRRPDKRGRLAMPAYNVMISGPTRCWHTSGPIYDHHRVHAESGLAVRRHDQEGPRVSFPPHLPSPFLQDSPHTRLMSHVRCPAWDTVGTLPALRFPRERGLDSMQEGWSYASMPRCVHACGLGSPAPGLRIRGTRWHRRITGSHLVDPTCTS